MIKDRPTVTRDATDSLTRFLPMLHVHPLTRPLLLCHTRPSRCFPTPVLWQKFSPITSNYPIAPQVVTHTVRRCRKISGSCTACHEALLPGGAGSEFNLLTVSVFVSRLSLTGLDSLGLLGPGHWLVAERALPKPGGSATTLLPFS